VNTVFLEVLEALREECGWSVEELANKMEKDKKTILDHRVRGAIPHPSTLKKYAEVFTERLRREITVSELKGRPRKNPRNTPKKPPKHP